MFVSDPDEPSRTGPLMQPGMNIRVGDVITKVNDVDASHGHPLAPAEPGGQAGADRGEARDGRRAEHVVTPISMGSEGDLRYGPVEIPAPQNRRRGFEQHNRVRPPAHDGLGRHGRLGPPLLPGLPAQGLILDVRNNRGGNIDSWILSRLLRKAWFFWQGRAGEPYWNMQYAFRGHVVLLCNENSGSDGEAISEGFRRLALAR